VALISSDADPRFEVMEIAGLQLLETRELR